MKNIKFLWRYRDTSQKLWKQAWETLKESGILCLFRHKWEYWLLLDGWKCSICGNPRSWYKDIKKPYWSQEYYSSKQFMKHNSEHQDAIRHRKTMKDGKVGYFNSRGERLA